MASKEMSDKIIIQEKGKCSKLWCRNACYYNICTMCEYEFNKDNDVCMRECDLVGVMKKCGKIRYDGLLLKRIRKVQRIING